MLEGKTKSGFEFKVDEDFFNDWEMIERIADYEENGSVHLMRSIIVDLLGKKQYKDLKDSLRDEKGKITATAMEQAVADIFEAIQEGETKN